MKKLLAIALSVTVSSGCVLATNPAKHPTANDVEITLDHDDYLRGDEKLDEQDYYMLLGDKKAEDEVASHRASGVRRQLVGSALIVLGIAVAAGTAWLYSNNRDQSPYINYAGLTGALILAGGGYQLRNGGAQKVRERRVLDSERAEVALNMFRYGVPKIGPGIVKQLDFAEVPRTYCGHNATALPSLVAADRRGKPIDLKEHIDWVNYSSVPAGAVSAYLAERGAVHSPLNESLAALGKPVKVTVAIADTPLAKTVELAQSLTCDEQLTFAGTSGSTGASGSTGGEGEVGGSGGGGGNGGEGPEVEVETAFVTYKGKRYLAAAARSGSDVKYALVEASRGSITATAIGGHGGTGGEGGAGGALNTRGLRGSCPELRSGSGGTGGPGGVGGRGGRLVARGPEDALAAIRVGAPGGGAGIGGDGGSAGSTMSTRGVGCYASAGKHGEDGPRGRAGSEGKVEKSVEPASSLGLLRKFLATNPEVRLDGDADGEDRPAVARKRRRG